MLFWNNFRKMDIEKSIHAAFPSFLSLIGFVVLNVVYITAYIFATGFLFTQGKIVLNGYQHYGIIFWIVYNVTDGLYLFTARKDAYLKDFKKSTRKLFETRGVF